MSVLTALERKIGWITIHHLPIYIVTAQAILYVWGMINPGALSLLTLDRAAVIYGREYWRLLTVLFVTPVQNPLFAIFFHYLFYAYGSALEYEWGSFRFTLFYLTGAVATAAASFLFGNWDGAFYLNTTIFLAFAAVHPDFQLLLFFVLPIKIKWLAWLTWAWLLYTMIVSPLPVKVAILISLFNYFLFFARQHGSDCLAYFRRLRHRRRYKDWNP